MSLTRLDEVGLKKAPSCYALFKSHLARNGVQSDRHGVPGRRLKVKTMMNDNPAAKWKSLSEDDKRKFKREARELAERLQEEKKRLLAAREAEPVPVPAAQPDTNTAVYMQSDGQAWRLKTMLGKGAYGCVWVMENTLSGGTVAGKECRDPSEVQKEQAILSRFHSPFLVSVFEYAVGPNNSVMLLMERADIGLAEMLHTWKETGV